MNRWVVLGLLFSGLVHADIVCRGQTVLGPAEVDIADGSVTISGAALSKPQVYASLDDQYDGHETELITAPGLSISFQNWYGCIHNAKITANFRDASQGGVGLITTLEASQCRGGSTPDQLCHAQ